MAESAHTVTAKQATEMATRVAALNAASSSLRDYFTAVADGLGIPEGAQLVRVDTLTNVLIVNTPTENIDG